jgi:hypothetical protein
MVLLMIGSFEEKGAIAAKEEGQMGEFQAIAEVRIDAITCFEANC